MSARATLKQPEGAAEERRLAKGVTGTVFFVSGFAAMIYQIVWQRALYSVFGINIESVTIVVTAFLAGLGVGSLIGGGLSKHRSSLLRLFAVAELAVGFYGFFSLSIFHSVGALGLNFSRLANAVLTIAILLPPTLLMGMTLPLLVASEVPQTLSTGRTVGSLYFANTIGSASAALAAVLAILPLMGEQGSVRLAASLNFIVGAVVLWNCEWRSSTQ